MQSHSTVSRECRALERDGALKRILGRHDQNSLMWLTIVVLAFLSVSLSLWSIPQSAVQYWYLYFSPLVLAAFRFGLRGALVSSVFSMISLLVLYRTAQDSLFPSIEALESLITVATSPSDFRALALQVADLRAQDPYTNFVRAISGSILLIISGILVGILSDRCRVQEVENRAAQRSSEQLRRFFSPNLVEALMSGQTEGGLGSTSRKELTVLFADLRGFTTVAEQLEPEELTRLLNDYLSSMTEVIFEFDGTLDKYIGDGIMAFFGDPVPYADHEERAIRAAVKMRDRFFELQSQWLLEGRENVTLGIGVHSGFVTVGSIGSPSRMEYTVIGSNVNLASRLSSMASPGQVLASARTYSQVRHLVEARAVGPLEVKGLPHPVEVVEVVGYRLVTLGSHAGDSEGHRLDKAIKRVSRIAPSAPGSLRVRSRPLTTLISTMMKSRSHIPSPH